MNNKDRAEEWLDRMQDTDLYDWAGSVYVRSLSAALDAAEARGRKENSVFADKLKAAVADLLGGELDYACEFVHHVKKDKHAWGKRCPVVTRYRALLVDDAKVKEGK